MRNGIIFLILIVLLILSVNISEVRSNNTSHTYETQTIPDEAIRLRILANSDNDHDQYIKNVVRDEVNAYITEIVQHIDDIEVGRRVIAESVPEVQKIAAQTLKDNNINQSVHVEYGSNIHFPLKVYDHFVYPAGEYEAVLITIGEGKGSNWWCVLFPPLCFLDFSNGTVVAESADEMEESEGIMEEDEEYIEIDEEETAEEELDEEQDVDSTEGSEEDEEEETFVVKFFLFEWLGLS